MINFLKQNLLILVLAHLVRLLVILAKPNRKLNAICGTPNYMAPELISRKEYSGYSVDIWAFGVVMYAMAEGKHPFKADSLS